MKVIIPAAGLGSRLRPQTYSIPKVLLPVAGKPIIGHIIDQVIGWGGTEIMLITGFLGDKITEYIDENFDIDVQYRTQEEPLGLGHAILTGIDPGDKELLVILGDTILEADLKPVIRRGITSIGVKEVPDPRKMGVVLVENDRVRKLIEKPPDPPSKLAIVGIYFIRDCALLQKAIRYIIDKNVTVKGEYQITDALQQLIEWDEPLETFPVEGWYDCGRPETILKTNRFLFDRREIQSSGYTTEETILIPPVAIGKDTVIRRSIIGPYVSIGSSTEIHDSIIRNSIIGDRDTIGNVLFEDTIIGNRADVMSNFRSLNLGASTQINL